MDPAFAGQLQVLTNDLVASISVLGRATASERTAALARARQAARERRNLLVRSLDRHPGFALRASLPTGLTSSLPADLRDLIEREVELSGRVVAAFGNDPQRSRSSRHYHLEVAGAPRPTRYRLHAAELPDHAGHEHPAAALVGELVTVRGFLLDGHLLMEAAGSIDGGSGGSTSMATGGTVGISGNQTTLVLLGNFQDKALDATCTTTTVHGRVFGASGSVHDVFKQSSQGGVTFSGATYGPYQLAKRSDACDMSGWADAMDQIATAQGINVASYLRKVYVLPQNACGWGGYAINAGSLTRSWIMQCQHTDLFAHELGHNLGFGHAWTPGNEYGDTSDIMGASGLALRQFSAPRKIAAGWISPARVVTVTGPGSFQLDATAATNPQNPQALVVPKPDTGEQYTLSFRQAIGYDGGLASSYLDRVSVHRGQAGTGAATTLLATLAAGQSFTDTVNGYRFTVNGVSASAAVTVDMASPTCARANPAVTVSPTTQSGAPGKAVTYVMSVVNKSSSGCGSATLGFAPQVPAGWTASFSPGSVTLASGASATVYWTVTSPATGVAAQSYTVASTTYDSAAASYAAAVQAAYIIANPDATLPSVRILSPAAGASVSGSVAVSVEATDNVGVAKVELWANDRLVGTDTAAPYGFNWNTRKLSGSYTLTARAFDAAGNAAQTSVTVSVGSSGGSAGGPKRK